MKFVWTFLTLLGIVGGVIGFLLDILVDYIIQGRSTLVDSIDETNAPGAKMIVWILYNLLFVVFSLLLTLWVSPIAEGSGIPPVKAILVSFYKIKTLNDIDRCRQFKRTT